MSCFEPLHGFRSTHKNPETGKRSIVFDRKAGFVDMPVTIPCGRCIGCRLDHAKGWAIRCVHEAQLHKENCFITLTYDQEHLPGTGTLVLEHFQKFMKRLRKRFKHQKIRFYHAGEYGTEFGRPHYHAILFGLDFHDKKLWKKVNDIPLFTSEILKNIWGKGFTSVGTVTFESAAYVARYIMKKVTGDKAKEHYERVDIETGEIIDLRPEYTTMSRGKGIAHAWWEKYKADVFPDDFVVIKGVQMKPPKYYEKMYEHENPEGLESIKLRRKEHAKRLESNNTQSRLETRKKIQEIKAKLLVRNLDTQDKEHKKHKKYIKNTKQIQDTIHKQAKRYKK